MGPPTARQFKSLPAAPQKGAGSGSSQRSLLQLNQTNFQTNFSASTCHLCFLWGCRQHPINNWYFGSLSYFSNPRRHPCSAPNQSSCLSQFTAISAYHRQPLWSLHIPFSWPWQCVQEWCPSPWGRDSTNTASEGGQAENWQLWPGSKPHRWRKQTKIVWWW